MKRAPQVLLTRICKVKKKRKKRSVKGKGKAGTAVTHYRQGVMEKKGDLEGRMKQENGKRVGMSKLWKEQRSDER